MSASGLDLRALIADAVRDVVAEMVTGPVARPASESESTAPRLAAGGEQVTAPASRSRVERVRIVDDADLNAFARQLLALYENPKNRQDLRAGRLTFRLDGRTGEAAASGPAVMVESGAVTERQVKAAHDAGRRIILGRRAVLTPLGRERARALGVPIEKER